MRTRPRPRVGEAATALLLLRYIPLRNQSRLIRRYPVEGRLVRALHIHAGSTDHALQTRRQNSRKINNAYNKNAYDFKRAQNKRV